MCSVLVCRPAENSVIKNCAQFKFELRALNSESLDIRFGYLIRLPDNHRQCLFRIR